MSTTPCTLCGSTQPEHLCAGSYGMSGGAIPDPPRRVRGFDGSPAAGIQAGNLSADAARMSTQVIGTCGNCGGPVEMPSMMVNPVARCRVCGATPKEAHGPVIPMKPSNPFVPPNQDRPEPERA